jgi:hypothetical protein
MSPDLDSLAGIERVAPFAGFVQRFDELIAGSTQMVLYYIHSRRWRENHDAAIKAFLGRPETTLEVFPPIFEPDPTALWYLRTDLRSRPCGRHRYFARLARDFQNPVRSGVQPVSHLFLLPDDRAVIALHQHGCQKELPAPRSRRTASLPVLDADIEDLRRECRARAGGADEVIAAAHEMAATKHPAEPKEGTFHPGR